MISRTFCFVQTCLRTPFWVFYDSLSSKKWSSNVQCSPTILSKSMPTTFPQATWHEPIFCYSVSLTSWSSPRNTKKPIVIDARGGDTGCHCWWIELETWFLAIAPRFKCSSSVYSSEPLCVAHIMRRHNSIHLLSSLEKIGFGVWGFISNVNLLCRWIQKVHTYILIDFAWL